MCNGLQIRAPRFDPGRGLQTTQLIVLVYSSAEALEWE